MGPVLHKQPKDVPVRLDTPFLSASARSRAPLLYLDVWTYSAGVTINCAAPIIPRITNAKLTIQME